MSGTSEATGSLPSADRGADLTDLSDDLGESFKFGEAEPLREEERT